LCSQIAQPEEGEPRAELEESRIGLPVGIAPERAPEPPELGGVGAAEERIAEAIEPETISG
jgi:hypothetical protein